MDAMDAWGREGAEYLPYQQYMFGAFMSTIVARTSGDPLALFSIGGHEPTCNLMDSAWLCCIALEVWNSRWCGKTAADP